MLKFIVLIFMAAWFLSCAAPRWETELRFRVLEEKVKILDAKIDSLSRIK